MPARIAPLALLVTLTASVAASQPEPSVTRDQLLEDVGLARYVVQELHPGLTLHASESALASASTQMNRRAYSNEADAVPLGKAYLLLAEGLAAVRDGHTHLNPYNQTEATEATLFARADRVPFAFRLMDEDRMIVTGDATPEAALPPGTEVLALDGRPVADVIEEMLPLVRADGGNDAKRRSLLEVDGTSPAADFDVLYGLLSEPTGPLALTVRRRDGTEADLSVPRMTTADRLAALRAAHPERPQTKRDLFSLRFVDDGAAVLRIGTFATFNMDGFDAQAWIAASFQQIRERGADRLVVDLRGNEGGLNDVAVALFQHLLSAPTEAELWGLVTAYDTIPQPLRRFLGSWSDDFYDLSDRVTPLPDGGFRMSEAQTLTVPPAPNALAGSIAVIVDAAASSATFLLADAIQRSGVATLVGQTTGGSLRGINAGQTAFLTLPNTGLVIDVPLFGSRPSTPGPDRGVIPDVVVPLDADALIAGRDLELEAALATVSGTPPQTDPSPLDALLGVWTVDLRLTPDAAPYTQPFVVSRVSEGTFRGSFYQTEVENVVVNDDWGDLQIAFTTSDGSGTYHHSATLRGDRLEGRTHSVGRGFLSVWTATRPAASQP
ncbi:MAG: S41 family peptidase [Bacteroidota bacterium]